MKFEKYQHVERFGNTETEGIENGLCYVFPKIDGTNASIWQDDNKIMAGSRNRELTLTNDNAGFYEWVIKQDNIKSFLNDNPTFRLYGEWLVPHTLKTYEESAWRKFYVFDVMNESGEYLDFDTYSKILEEYLITYIQPICTIQNPRLDSLMKTLDKNIFLIRDGEGVGEGVVIKNYSYKNRFGRVTWAKIVRNEFKEANKKSFGIPEINQTKMIEERFIDDYCIEGLIEKEYNKIVTEVGWWESKYIPRLLQTVFYCLITEELWNALKKYKMPKIDFRYLEKLCTNKIKNVKKELF